MFTKQDHCDSERTNTITVRIPNSMWQALKEEAHQKRTSLNKLAISKMLQPLDPEEDTIIRSERVQAVWNKIRDAKNTEGTIAQYLTPREDLTQTTSALRTPVTYEAPRVIRKGDKLAINYQERTIRPAVDSMETNGQAVEDLVPCHIGEVLVDAQTGNVFNKKGPHIADDQVPEDEPPYRDDTLLPKEEPSLCPKCQSKSIRPIHDPTSDHEWSCDACGHEWCPE